MATFVGGWGHAEPLLPFAELARSAGHEVTFMGQPAILPRLAERGFRTGSVGPVTLGDRRRPLVPVDRARERQVMRDHFVIEFGTQRAARLGDVFAAERPQLVVCDEVDVGAVVAAERLAIPCVSVDVIAAGVLTSPAVVGAAWQHLRMALGVPVDPRCERLGGDLALSPVPRSFREGAVASPGRRRWVRPPLIDALAGTAGGPVVYATLGTVFNIESGDLLERLVAALELVAEPALLTTGPHIDAAELQAVHPGVRIEPYVPVHEALSGCRAVVCHGGSGTLIAALSCGVPVVVLPMGADQPDNADRCTALGVGITLDAVAARPRDIAAAVASVLDDATYARAAGELAAEARRQPRLEDVSEVLALL
jgi:UDP:flavonoid glycosyltransferase YjiC (YdhE family)